MLTIGDMNKTLPRLMIGSRHGRDGTTPPPMTAPISKSDHSRAESVFDYTKTLSRSDSKVFLRRHGSNRSLKRKSLMLSRSGEYSMDPTNDSLFYCTVLTSCLMLMITSSDGSCMPRTAC